MNKRVRYIFPLVGIVLIIVILTVLIFLSTTVKSAIMDQAIDDNTEMTAGRASVIVSVIEKNGDEIDRFMRFTDLGFSLFLDKFDSFSAADAISQKMSCKTLVYFMKDGTSFYANGMAYDNRNQTINALRDGGVNAVSSIYFDENLREQMIVIFSTYEDGENVKSAAGAYLVSEIYSQCRFTDNLGNEFYFIDKNGDILFSPSYSDTRGQSLKSVLMKYNFSTDEISVFFSQLSENKSHTYTNGNDDNRTIIGTSPIGEKGDFYAISITPQAATVASVFEAFNSSIIISAIILFLFVGVIIYLRITENRYSAKLILAENIDKIANCNNQARFETEAESLLKNRFSARYAILYISIRNFNYINRVYGFRTANEVVALISKAIRDELHGEETYGRLVDGRLVTLVSYVDKPDIVKRFTSIAKTVASISLSDGIILTPKLASGIYCIDRDEKFSVAEMIDFAVFAQQSIPEDSRETSAFYTQSSRDDLTRAVKIEEAMETALANGEFEMYLQPKYNIQKNCIDGAEALARWTGSEMGIITPDQFISQFERHGFITGVDRFMLEQACMLLAEQKMHKRKSVPISVNVSRMSARRPDFLETYLEMKKQYAIDDGLLELEFTESIALEDYEYLEDIIHTLKQNGYTCSIDDFGSGFSSFKALKQMRFDAIKLDKMFLMKSDDPKRDQVVLSGIIDFVKHLDMKVITEGVETESELTMLRKMGCDTIQGYLYAKPMPLVDFHFFVDKANANKVRPGQSSESFSVDKVRPVADGQEL